MPGINPVSPITGIVPIRMPLGDDTMLKYKVFFDRKSGAVDGLLTVQNQFGQKLFNRIPARSGQAGYTDTSWVRGKSPIPYGVFNLHLSPNNLGQSAGQTGIGEFFPIDSEGDRLTIRNKAKTLIRTEIGLHEENIFKGSAGCIVIVQHKDWVELSTWLRAQGKLHKTLELEVL